MDHGYDAVNDPYCYSGSDTLKNKLGLRDGDKLEAFELEMTTLRGTEPLPAGKFDEVHYRRVHRHLFQDVYSWAGKDRTIRTAKGGNLFCVPEYIDTELKRVFRRLRDSGCLETSNRDEFVSEVALFLSDLNAIHPFREGNGRAQLAFIHLIGEAAGHPFELSRVRQSTFIPAMISSFQGELDPLVAELTSLLA